MRVLLLLTLLLSVAFSQILYVASASSMRPLLERIARSFERKHPGVKLMLSYGSSGNIYRQILGGAPYDVFLSANELYPKKLVELGMAHEPTEFARGRLAVFSTRYRVDSLNVLERAGRVAIANPKYAPYGRAAVEFLKRSGIYEKVKRKLVYGSNVGQAFQFVVAGGADAGVVSLSLVLAYGKGSYLIVPEGMHSPIRHVAVITERGLEKKASRKFVEYLRTTEVGHILKEYGFGVP